MLMGVEGIHRVRKKLRNGIFRYHYYAFRGGPRFWTCDTYAVSKTSPPIAFVEAYRAAIEDHRQSIAAAPEIVTSLLDRFIDSSEFTQNLDIETQKFYKESLKDIQLEFGKDEVAIFLDKETRRDIKAWRDKWKDKPRTADKRVGALVKVLNFAVDEGDLEFHVAHRIKKLYKANRAHVVWEDDEVARLLNCMKSNAARLTIELASFTGMRREDLVSIPASADKDSVLEFYTSKSNGRHLVALPITSGTRSVLQELSDLRNSFKVPPMTMTFNSRGLPWTPDGLSKTFQNARNKCGVAKRLHDLRGTACTKFIRAGVKDDEIAELMGWSTDIVKQMRRVYVTNRAYADGIVDRLERTQRER